MMSDAVMQDDSKKIVRNWCKRNSDKSEMQSKAKERKERDEEWKEQYNIQVERN